MLIYLYGSDSYRLKQKLNSIIDAYKKKHSDLTMDYFDFAESPDDVWLKLKNFVVSQSLFGSLRLGIVYGLPNEKEKVDFLKGFLDSRAVSLIIVVEKPLGKDFNFLLKKPVLAQNFDLLDAPQLTAFIKSESRKKNLSLSSEQIYSLIRANEANTGAIMMEIEKIALGGEVAGDEFRPDFFSMISRLSGPAPLSSKISSLTWLLETNEPAKVFNMLSAFVKNTEEKTKIADYDVAIKSGKLDYEEALLDLVISH